MHQPSPEDRRQQAADLDACRDKLANGSRTFLAASRLLPRRVRDPAIALYAFCREADDIIDIGGATEGNLALLADRLDAIYRNAPHASPTDRAFATIVQKFDIPRTLPDALIEGFAWDAGGRRYETLGDVLAYATRVAGSVGAMMALLMGARDRSQLARACDLGIAMQISNIARDVGEDARAGRIYLPLAWMREVQIEPETWLRAPNHSPQLAEVVERLLRAADSLYRRAGRGISALPVDCRAGIFAAAYLYGEIGNEVRRNGHDSVSRRAVVPAKRKIELAAKAAIAASLSLTQSPPVIPDRVFEAAYLVDSVLPATGEPALPAWWNLPARTARIIDLFERLEIREREAQLARLALTQIQTPSRAKA
ncbi:MAG: phytoene/squalene synthase family protein [Hyphomicrobium sp.]|jgi:phytoene synthase|nr:phytoene/squalene synthase family protein [Hyphomicrobium sp.]